MALLFVHLEVAFAPHDFAVALEGQNVRGHAVQEPAIVANDHRTPAEVVEGFFQRAERVHVEVVRRFVEQQQVAAAS